MKKKKKTNKIKSIHYREGALKRKFKMKRGVVEPGGYISKVNEQKLSKKDVAIRGLI